MIQDCVHLKPLTLGRLQSLNRGYFLFVKNEDLESYLYIEKKFGIISPLNKSIRD